MYFDAIFEAVQEPEISPLSVVVKIFNTSFALPSGTFFPPMIGALAKQSELIVSKAKEKRVFFIIAPVKFLVIQTKQLRCHLSTHQGHSFQCLRALIMEKIIHPEGQVSKD